MMKRIALFLPAIVMISLPLAAASPKSDGYYGKSAPVLLISDSSSASITLSAKSPKPNGSMAMATPVPSALRSGRTSSAAT